MPVQPLGTDKHITWHLSSRSVVSDCLPPHGLQHARLPCHSLSPGVCSDSCPSSHLGWWMMPSNLLVHCHPLLLLPSVFPIIMVFSNESALCIRWPKYWSFCFNISPSNEYSELISFRIDRFDLLAVWGTLKSLLQYHSSKQQFFGAQPSFWSNSHIHTWLLEKSKLWLDRLLMAKWCISCANLMCNSNPLSLRWAQIVPTSWWFG